MTIAIKSFIGLSHGVSLQLLFLTPKTPSRRGILSAGTHIFRLVPLF